jgi:hypothetical protein
MIVLHPHFCLRINKALYEATQLLESEFPFKDIRRRTKIIIYAQKRLFENEYIAFQYCKKTHIPLF